MEHRHQLELVEHETKLNTRTNELGGQQPDLEWKSVHRPPPEAQESKDSLTLYMTELAFRDARLAGETEEREAADGVVPLRPPGVGRSQG